MQVIKELKDCLFWLMMIQLIHTKNAFYQKLKLKTTTLKLMEEIYDQPMDNLIKQYEEVRKVSTGQVIITRLVVY